MDVDGDGGGVRMNDGSVRGVRRGTRRLWITGVALVVLAGANWASWWSYLNPASEDCGSGEILGSGRFAGGGGSGGASAGARGSGGSRDGSAEREGPIRRRGSVDLEETYDLSGLTVPMDEIHTLLPRDAIPALTDPETVSVEESGWLEGDSRVLVATVGDETLIVPLAILDYHEVVNATVGGRAVAATYCPLCDSATLFSREVDPDGAEGEAEPVVLEFGVSGALYNSNVLMYDRRDMGLWSQLGMEAVSGPLVGTGLELMAFGVMGWEEARAAHGDARVVSVETGYNRPYERGTPYEDYFARDELMVPVVGVGDALPKKTLGVGILAGGESVFVALDRIGDVAEVRVSTGMGEVVLSKSDAGAVIRALPEGVHAAQTFYYSWSAFRPGTRVFGEPVTEEGDR